MAPRPGFEPGFSVRLPALRLDRPAIQLMWVTGPDYTTGAERVFVQAFNTFCALRAYAGSSELALFAIKASPFKLGGVPVQLNCILEALAGAKTQNDPVVSYVP